MNEAIVNHIKTNVKFLTAEDAIRLISPAATMMAGGFGLAGIPEYLLQAVVERSDLRDLTMITNSITVGSPLDKLCLQNRIKKVIGTYFTTNKEIVKAHREGRLEIELLPLGTFVEAIRLGGAGIPAFYTPTAAGTDLGKGKETRIMNGREHVLEHSLFADVALIKAHKADKAGNLIFHKTARNFNSLMVTAANLTIVEVEEIVEIGEFNPESIVTPFIYVDIIVIRGATK
ncbi:acyl CoA:acetate/3-ketoacid CoA transferase, alpha subunit [Neobacillus bataviensis LMG 21833]|uniref:Acyl CoA:acetate/3-ketoacid CoA transferase, alpha subunit n=1 Tax=Neobacillus bataviensis LMG 21833 TaxID=1117379 RepID=K6EB44_9BACI|nr:3-oxoacid CoA-transferase subunit A [Neobacillus bataviensis]EKN70641.1 acyl CoA:acetate/3-ketoacid CoA transferase, alpha subunit [Neobacillus bataviensis LMG 21833]